jgi:hypothetical protein
MPLSLSLSLYLSLSLSLSPMLSCDFFSKFPNALAALDQKPDVNVVVHFCAGINLTTLGSISDKSLSRSD